MLNPLNYVLKIFGIVKQKNCQERIARVFNDSKSENRKLKKNLIKMFFVSLSTQEMRSKAILKIKIF